MSVRTGETIWLSCEDDSGVGDDSWMGYAIGLTATDRIGAAIARGGARFNKLHANGPVCSVSRILLLLGQNCLSAGAFTTLFSDAVQNNQWNETSGLGRDDQTIYKIFAERGWKVGHFGKWHAGAGADVRSMLDLGVAAFSGWAFPNLPDGTRSMTDPQRATLGEFDDYITRDPWVADDTLAWLDTIKPTDNIVLSTQWLYPHYPNYIREAWLAKVEGLNERDKFRNSPGAEVDRHSARAKFAAAGYGNDLQVGRVLNKLREMGRLPKAHIIQTSDNGGGTRMLNPTTTDQCSYAGPNRGAKGTVYDGGLQVRGSYTAPGVDPGLEVNTVMYHMDLLPTLAEAFDITYDNSLADGESMLDVLVDGKDRPRATDVPTVTIQAHTNETSPWARSPNIRWHSPAGHIVREEHELFINLDGTEFAFYKTHGDDGHERDLRGVAPYATQMYGQFMHDRSMELRDRGLSVRGDTAGKTPMIRRPHLGRPLT